VHIWNSIVTDLINALSGYSYVNMVQHATIDEAVFSMSSAPSNSWNGVICDQLLGYAPVLTIELFSVWSMPRSYSEIPRINPCGGGVGYLHRDPASRRRRRKGKFQI
jgi:hypothetical protein